ncbi:MFS transporter [Rhodopila sp.]|uniref:MFS transporter n=1 Tax=Rhodopila sp. TaxID=2480087 RepID=UPI002D7EF226|nr:MFS transporter [Rhodopila sp.]
MSENVANQPVGGMATAVPLTASLVNAPTLKPASDSSTTLAILVSLSVCHLLNDMNQSLVPAMYPILKDSYGLDFGQIGLITLAFQLTASLLQPVVGMVTDKRPQPFSLPIAMGSSLAGLLLLSVANSYGLILLAAALVGIGSSVFHPESSRIARLASGGRYGFAQSLFQLGGSTGSSIGPLLAAFIVVPRGQGSVAWFSAAALLAILILANVSLWYSRHPAMAARRGKRAAVAIAPSPFKRSTVIFAFTILLVLLFSKNVYTASLSSYFTFYLIQKFGVSVQSAQLHLFAFLAAVAAGTFFGGPIGDRVGRKPVIWFSILGAFPFALMLPYASLMWTGVLSVTIGFILASAFSAIVVYAQELMPGRVGMVAGMVFGFSFGLGGLGAAALGQIADMTSIETVYKVCSFLPLIGLLTALLPNIEKR